MDSQKYEQMIKQNCIDWNKKQFFRAINEERWHDAARFKSNIEGLEGPANTL